MNIADAFHCMTKDGGAAAVGIGQKEWEIISRDNLDAFGIFGIDQGLNIRVAQNRLGAKTAA
ncbi:MAG: hypothetical protein AAFN51_10620 [Pseudomonadota bacterium]